MSLLDIDKQAEMITARLDIEDLKDPEKLAGVPQALHAPVGGFQSGFRRLQPRRSLIGQPLQAGLGGDLLASLQNLKLGGT